MNCNSNMLCILLRFYGNERKYQCNVAFSHITDRLFPFGGSLLPITLQLFQAQSLEIAPIIKNRNVPFSISLSEVFFTGKS